MKKLLVFFILLHFTGFGQNTHGVVVPGYVLKEGALLIIFMIIIAVLIYNNMQLKKKDEHSKHLLQQQEGRYRSVIVSEERERSRVVHQLQDGIGQQLSAAKLNVSALQAFLKATTDAEKIMFQNAVNLLDDSVKEVRNVSHKMIPNALIKSGLVSALREFISEVTFAGKVKINFEIVGFIDRLEQTKEVVLFRVMQEVITNSIKHAKATEVGIQFVKHEKELSILIVDNGIGFDVNRALENDKDTGLRTIQSRTEFLDGNVFFDSMPTRGTTVTIEIPM